jgi:hypothetical protein
VHGLRLTGQRGARLPRFMTPERTLGGRSQFAFRELARPAGLEPATLSFEG